VSAVALEITQTACSTFTSPHPHYAPLLDHAGQVDVQVRGHGAVIGGPTLGGGANVGIAYAPVDHLVIVAGGDVFFGQNRARRYSGQVGVGVFARDDVLRLEAIVGAFGGGMHGSGTFLDEPGRYRLDARYVLPYAQLFVGWERESFELAVGIRVSALLADVKVTPSRGAPPLNARRIGTERAQIEPSLTIRLPFDFFRLDFEVGAAIWAGHDSALEHLTTEDGDSLASDGPFLPYFAVGIGFQLDTVEPPPREVYTTPFPPGAYVPQ
jgi:hypothetical protein